MSWKSISTLFINILLFVSCEIDNYDAPDGGLYGQILDIETGEAVPQPVPSDFGLRLRFYEAGRDNSLEQHFYAQTDGSFRNSRIFNGPVRLVVEQRNFFPVDTLLVQIQGQTKRNILVLPYARVSIDHASVNQQLITVRFSINRSEQVATGNYEIVQCNLLWNVSPYIDNQTANYAGFYSLLLSANNQELDLSTADNQAQLRRLANVIQGNDNRIYLRICVITEDKTDSALYYNYSEIVPVQLNIQSFLNTLQCN
ncbi:hypothetical protein AGMMS50262_02620 [Bacteroidia bacterium]|nr:hypothetical protein AGMMS50262_02620 [Bacteroidia bacterium]